MTDQHNDDNLIEDEVNDINNYAGNEEEHEGNFQLQHQNFNENVEGEEETNFQNNLNMRNPDKEEEIIMDYNMNIPDDAMYNDENYYQDENMVNQQGMYGEEEFNDEYQMPEGGNEMNMENMEQYAM